MSSIEDALYARLSTDAAVTALVSTRIYPVHAPQGATYPAVVFTRLDTTATTALGTASRFFNSRFQFDAWAKTYESSKAIVTAIRESLDALDTTILGVRIWAIVYNTEVDIFEDETQLYRNAVDFDVIFSQP